MAIIGLGTQLKRWDSSGGSWQTIGNIVSITPLNPSRDTVDVTTYADTDGYRKFIGGLRDGGSVTFTMLFTREGYELLFNDFESNTLQNYEIVLPDDVNTTFEFEGLVTEMPLSTPIDEKVTVDVTIKISGAPYLGSGGSESPGMYS